MVPLTRICSAFALWISCCRALAPKGAWDRFNLAPVSRTVYPKAIHSTNGSVSESNLLVDNKGKATFVGMGSWVALDFGVEVGGLISMNFDSITSTSALALSFTESPLFIRPTASDDSAHPSSNTTYDGVLRVNAPLKVGHWTQPAAALRGGFRYLTIVSTSPAAITISNVSCAISFMPHVDDMRAYSGYFYTSDPLSQDEDFLTKVWYAGAYTVQTNTVPVDTGRHAPSIPGGFWANDGTLGVAGPIIVDGAKRDRTVWPGDMGIAVPAQFVSTDDLIPTRNALSTMFAAINPTTGALPYCGPPLSLQGSDTYHAWTLIGTHNYFLYSGDASWLQTVWTNYTKAVAFLEAKVDETGLMNVTGTEDWARLGGGGYTSGCNALLYRVLTTATDLANHLHLTDLESAWAKNATSLKQKFNEAFWLESAGMYRDNLTTTLCPQDANSFAILYNLTASKDQAKQISDGLRKNWNELGPVAPELPDTIIPFISGFEVQAHFEAANDARALDLIRRTWGYMLYTNISVQSTLLEGFTANGSLAYRYYRGYNNDPAYTSHSHGWSAGATPALTFYLLGLTIASPQGKTWTIAPHIEGGPTNAEGGFSTDLGWFGVKWELTKGADGKIKRFQLDLDTPRGTAGSVVLPGSLRGLWCLVDGVQFSVFKPFNFELEGGMHSIVVGVK